MNNLELENWLPMEPTLGPPLPRFLNIYWPWYKPPLPEPPEKGVVVGLLNPPSGAERWQLILFDWNKTQIGSKYDIAIIGPATFEIPPETIFPLRVDMLIYHNGTIDYRMQSVGTEFPFPPEWFIKAYIPDYASYYYNVATERFEEV